MAQDPAPEEKRERRDRTDTHCPYCALQCGLTLFKRGDGFGIEPRDFPSNRGGLCRKGWTSAELLDAPNRLTKPLLRTTRGSTPQPVSWEEALAHTAREIARLQASHGPDAVGVYGGGGLTNEKAYALGKFARVVLGTKHIDYNGRFCMASGAVANQRAFGLDRGMPFPLSDLPGAEVILLAGSNLAETMPPVMQYLDEQHAQGGKLIVVDPRRTATAERASLHLQLTPGTDAALANALLHVAIRDKLIHTKFIRERTRDFELARHTADRYWPDRAERITGVHAGDIVKAAHMLGEAATAITLSARGAEQQVQGVDNARAYINLMLALGHAGRRHCGYGCVTGQGNGQGGREHGQKSDQLPGYRSLKDEPHRALVAERWGVGAHTLPQAGPSACEMFETLGEQNGVRALIVMGANPVVSAPHAQKLVERLPRLELLVVADMFPSETVRHADVVLPICQWAEEEGTLTNLEGRLLYRQPALPPPAGVRSDLEVLKGLADALGKGEHLPDTPEATFDELCRVSAGGPADYGGFSYARLKRGEELFWPCPSAEHPGTPRLFLDRFATEDGRARFAAIEQRDAPDLLDEEFPLFLTNGRLLSQYQTGNQTRRVRSLLEAHPDATLEMHPQTARTYGIGQGDWVHVTTRRGRAIFKAQLTASMRMDTLFVPFHWPDASCANHLTSDALDPISKIPAFKFATASIERANTYGSGPPPDDEDGAALH